MNTQAYREGFDRGIEGESSSCGIFEGWFDKDRDQSDRDEGYKAGVLANAIRGDDED